jgi:1-acyl-sn-glycerol-3-phosphate acyltransferase
VSRLGETLPRFWGGEPEGIWRFFRPLLAPPIALTVRAAAYGGDRVPPEGGALLAANHFSGIDHPLIGTYCPRVVYFMAKSELFEIPVLGTWLRWMGTYPIRRGEADRESVRHSRELVRNGKVVVVHLEGHRQPFGHPGPIHYGGLMIALTEKVSVIPCALDTWRWSPTNRRPCTIVFGEPMTFEGLPRGRAGYEQAGRAVEAEIARLWRMAAQAAHDGFPDELSDGTKRSGWHCWSVDR